jgi:hypothetical protein
VAETDWGFNEDPHPIAANDADAGRSHLEPGELPEVTALAAEGWELAPDAPFLAFLPAVWPRGLRTWIPDRSTRYSENWSAETNQTERVEWTPEVRAVAEADEVTTLAEAGIDAPPRGRLWLLRPPPGFESVGDVLAAADALADRRDVAPGCSREYVDVVSDTLVSR